LESSEETDSASEYSNSCDQSEVNDSEGEYLDGEEKDYQQEEVERNWWIHQ
jgi:hypothetical protein